MIQCHYLHYSYYYHHRGGRVHIWCVSYIVHSGESMLKNERHCNIIQHLGLSVLTIDIPRVRGSLDATIRNVLLSVQIW